jgi:ATP-dependent DNA helicase RecQ
MLAKFDDDRAAFLKQIFKHARQAKVWWSLKLDEAMAATGAPRERIVAALNYLEEQGDLKLQVAGARQGYRLKHLPEDLAATAEKLAKRFLEREERDSVRVQEMLKFADADTCRTRLLLDYFGQPTDKDCGHCDRCEGQPKGRLPATHRHALGEYDAAKLKKLAAERHKSLRSPRQVARFLCGITSPQTSRERLGRHPMFGAWAGRPFREVLEFVETTNQA